MPTLVNRLLEAIRLRPAATIAVVVALLVVGVSVNIGLRHASGDAEGDLTPTRHRADLARLQLRVAGFELAGAQGDEVGATAQRDASQRRLAAVQQQLQGVQQQLASTSEAVALQGPQIEALGRCLNGVSSALNQAAVADTGATRTLLAAQVGCREAQAAISGAPSG